MHPDVNWKIDKRAVRERLCRVLDDTSQPRSRSAEADQLAAGPVVLPHEVERDSEPPRPAEVQVRALAMKVHAGEPTGPEHLVPRLTAALATPRPWQRIADPDRAGAYFEARARHMLATARDPVAHEALIRREEREAERWVVTATTNDNPKEHHHG
jgi:hypothetical protein